MSDNAPWRDAETLRELYHGQSMTMSEISDELGCSQANISKWMSKHAIDRRSPNESRELRDTQPDPSINGIHDDEEWLREKYHSENCSLTEMANLANVSEGTILNRMVEFDIPRRSPAAHLDKEKNSRSQKRYPRVHAGPRGDHHSIALHRIVAIGEFGLDAVAGSVVHHKNGVIWDNRPENLEIVDTQASHAKRHASERERDEYGRFE